MKGDADALNKSFKDIIQNANWIGDRRGSLAKRSPELNTPLFEPTL